ncbi:MAG: nucleoside monophosphate kinase [Patescibacteria group bacterium]|nr:nucleoside monophosphate kinase [Patescibacteria group bacterium]
MIILMGISGVGKSVQGQLFTNDGKYSWVSVGNLVRQKMDGEAKKNILRGELLNDQQIIELVQNVVSKSSHIDQEIVMDGFPRTIYQAKWLTEQIKKGKICLTGIFFLHASEEVVTKRLLSRGREDDRPEIIKKRFSQFKTKTVPITKFLKENNIDIIDINGDNNPQKVHQDILRALQEIRVNNAD